MALIAGVTLVATPYLFGFATGLFNMMAAGYIVGGATLGLGTLMAVKTLFTDIITMRKRVKKQQQEEQNQERLERLRQELEKLREEHKNSAEHQDPKELDQKTEPEHTEENIKAKRLKFLRRWIERKKLAQEKKTMENKRLNILRWLRNKREGRRAA